MGQSPSARLCFGIRIPGSNEYEDSLAQEWMDAWYEAHEDDEDGFELDSYLAERAGLENPYRKLPDAINYGGCEVYAQWKRENPWFEKALDEFWETKRRLEKNSPVELVGYGSYEYGGHILALKGASHWATGWTPDAVDVKALVAKVTPEAIASATIFCLNHDLPSFADAQWWLCPSYG